MQGVGISWATRKVRRSRRLSRWLTFVGPLAVVLAVMPVLRAVDVLLPDLVSEWRPAAKHFRDQEQPATAVAYEKCASELEDALARVVGRPAAKAIRRHYVR